MTTWCVTGLGFGDEGKGTVTDYLCSRGGVAGVVRHNGGAQAAHHVVTDDGRTHCFAQFGSGTLQGVPTFLSRYMLFNPLNLIPEANHLIELGIDDPYSMLAVSENALLITPYHVAANRKRELQRGDGRHGSCGQGIGETQSYANKWPDVAPRAHHLRGDERVLEMLLLELRQELEDEVGSLGIELGDGDIALRLMQAADRPYSIVRDNYLKLLADDGDIVFEGAQGALLDEEHGFDPYTTWSKTTAKNAFTLCREARIESPRVIGVTRAYTTRHGAGPFPSEDWGLSQVLPEPHNATGEWQGAWRVGHLDMGLLRYALEACAQDGAPVDELAVTHLDSAEVAGISLGTTRWCYDASYVPWTPVCGTSARDLTRRLAGSRGHVQDHVDDAYTSLTEQLRYELGVPVTIESWGPSALDKRELVYNAPSS